MTLDIVLIFNKNFHDKNLYTRSWVLNGVTNLFIDYWTVRGSPGQLVYSVCVCVWVCVCMCVYVNNASKTQGGSFEP
jgi:hypothetical protein